MSFVSRLIVLTIGLLFMHMQSTAQPVSLGKDQVLQQPLPLYLNYGSFYIDLSNTQDIAAVSAETFYPFSHYFKTVPRHLPTDQSVWVKIQVQSFFPNDTVVVFYPGFQNYVEVFHSEAGRFTRTGICGNLFPASLLTIKDTRQAVYLPVPRGELSSFFIRIRNLTTYHVDPFTPYLISKGSLDALQVKAMVNSQQYAYIFFIGIGMFVIMFIYIAIKWAYTKDMAYLYYALTICFSGIFFLLNFLQEKNNQLFFSENPLLIYLLPDAFALLSLYAYWQFIRKFLYINAVLPALDRFMFYTSNSILAFFVFNVWYAFQFKHLMGLVIMDTTAGMVLIIIGVYTLIRVRKVNAPLRRFVYGGISCMLIFYALGSIYELIRDTSWNVFPDMGGGTPLVMMGNITEMLFFTLGLAYRGRLEAEEKVVMQKSLIEQLEKHQQLQKKYNQELEQEVDDKTKEVLEKNRLLEEERTAKLQSDFRTHMAEAEIKALRAQMNPHFIFNCMHTIDAYIFREQPEKASRFLNTFSRLIRLVLENSQHTLVPLNKELEGLQLFTQLEQERYDNSFDVEYHIAPGVLHSHYKIPPLLIQPYVENAILHGLRHKKNSRGALCISVDSAGSNLLISVKDNGIGRAAAQRIKAINGRAHESLALVLTQQRLDLMSQKGSVEIIDLMEGGETGTEVKLVLPAIT
jgi:two-component system LytT family sensor kinase